MFYKSGAELSVYFIKNKSSGDPELEILTVKIQDLKWQTIFLMSAPG